MKTYFTKYIPVEGYPENVQWQWYNNIQNTGWENISPSDMDAIIAHGLKPVPEFRKVKLFLCSRDIQVGDKFTQVGIDLIHPTARFTCVDRFEKEGDIWIIDDDNNNFVIYNKDCPNKILCYKVIGEVSPDAIWVTEGMEFDESEIKMIIVAHKPPEHYKDYRYYKIKCPTCKQFH